MARQALYSIEVPENATVSTEFELKAVAKDGPNKGKEETIATGSYNPLPVDDNGKYTGNLTVDQILDTFKIVETGEGEDKGNTLAGIDFLVNKINEELLKKAKREVKPVDPLTALMQSLRANKAKLSPDQIKAMAALLG